MDNNQLSYEWFREIAKKDMVKISKHALEPHSLMQDPQKRLEKIQEIISDVRDGVKLYSDITGGDENYPKKRLRIRSHNHSYYMVVVVGNAWAEGYALVITVAKFDPAYATAKKLERASTRQASELVYNFG